MREDELWALVNNAAFLYERLEPAWQPVPNPFDGATVERRLARWRQVAANGDGERFAQRLAWLGLDDTAARGILGAGGYAPGTPLPDWATFLAQVVAAAGGTPAAEIAPPFARSAQARLAQSAGESLIWLAPHARQTLSGYLTERLERLAQTTFTANHNRLLTVHCLHYPVLARQFAQTCLDWAAEVADFLQRLADDWSTLVHHLGLPVLPPAGVVTGLTPGLSDPHRGGRTVWRAELAGRVSVAYKPKSMALDRAWNDLLLWCNAQGLSPRLPHLWTLPRPGYGWMEWAEGNDRRADPRQMGALLGLLHTLHAADCHRENLVIRDGQPLLVDAEMLVYPRFAGREQEDPLDVLRTGLLPRWLVGADGPVPFDGGAEGASPAAVEEGFAACLAFLAARWEELNGAATPDRYATDNLLPSEWSLFAHLSDVDPQSKFEKPLVRVAPRPTAAYARLLDYLRQPACLGDGVDFSVEADRLAWAYLSQPSQARLWPLLAAEHRAINRGDVPLFHGAPGQPELLHANGALPDALTWPAFALPSAPAQAQQTGLIRATLERTAWLSPSPASFLETARQLGDLLAARAVPLDGGGVGWICVQYRPGSGLWQHGLVGDDLYAGRAGIALFLAGLFRATGEACWRELALAGLRADADAAADPGGRIYALSTASHLLAAPALAERAEKLACGLSSEGDGWRSSVYPWGVLDGEAGLLLGLLALHRRTASPEILREAVGCGQGILRAGDEWTHPRRGLGGFSHGAAGIGYGLARLYAATGDARFREAAERAWAFQRALYDDPAGNWQDRRGPVPVYLDNWCNGAAGIGLAAAGCLDTLPELADVVERVRKTCQVGGQPGQVFPMNFARPPDRSILDTLCCGHFGQIDCRLEMGLICRRPEWVSAAIAQAEGLLGQARERGAFRLYDDLPAHLFNPGFFRGVAGIGYTLLRLAAGNGETAERLPCVAGWQVA